MTTMLLGAILAVLLVNAIEGYLIFGQNQYLKTHNEQLLAAAATLFAAVPGKSAQRTDAPDDAKPRIWYRALRQPAAAELARWEDDGGTTDDTPAAPPATEPMPRIDIAGGLPTARPAPARRLDDVDRQLARFTYVEGHRR